MNICHCGAQAGHIHSIYCPYPLYHEGSNQVERWRELFRIRVEFGLSLKFYAKGTDEYYNKEKDK